MYDNIAADLEDYLGERNAAKIRISEILECVYYINSAPPSRHLSYYRSIIEEEKERLRKQKDIALELKLKQAGN